MRRMLGWIAREDRERVSLSGSALLPDGRTISVEVTNISSDGCDLNSDETLRIGDAVWLTTSKHTNVAATIRWSLHGRAGLRFLNGKW
jgi:hypothetical protein